MKEIFGACVFQSIFFNQGVDWNNWGMGCRVLFYLGIGRRGLCILDVLTIGNLGRPGVGGGVGRGKGGRWCGNRCGRRKQRVRGHHAAINVERILTRRLVGNEWVEGSNVKKKRREDERDTDAGIAGM